MVVKEDDVLAGAAVVKRRGLPAAGRGTLSRFLVASIHAAVLASLVVLVYLGLRGVPPFERWSVNSLFLAGLVLLFLFLRFERAAVGPRELALAGTLAAVAAAGRVLFAAVPGVQPVTFLSLLAGYVFGVESGFVVGALAALLSNFFLGHGPWTPWQMLGWGLAGISGGLLHPLSRGERGRAVRLGTRLLVVLGAAWGFLFGWMMDLWYWASFVRPLDWRSLSAAFASSFWFDLLHSLGNVAFALLVGPAMFSALLRFRGRLRVVWVDRAPRMGSGGRCPGTIESPECIGTGGKTELTTPDAVGCSEVERLSEVRGR
ncbi:MAG: ECF transporter S component [Candidatus Geothermincolales bacterium]